MDRAGTGRAVLVLRAFVVGAGVVVGGAVAVSAATALAAGAVQPAVDTSHLIEVEGGWYDPTTHKVFPSKAAYVEAQTAAAGAGGGQGESEAKTNDRAAAGAGMVDADTGLIKVQDGWYHQELHRVFPTMTAYEGYAAGRLTLDQAARPLPTPTGPEDFAAAESGVLTEYAQLTSELQFSRAGEAYFDPAGRWIVFQASPRSEWRGNDHGAYQMYVARLQRLDDGTIVGIDEPIRLSPEGSENTCGWFDPNEPWRVIFGSTITEPSRDERPGFQRGTSRYVWAFPPEMEVCEIVVPEIYADYKRAGLVDGSERMGGDGAAAPKVNPVEEFLPREQKLRPLFERPGMYDAECAYSPDGRHIVFTSHEQLPLEGELYVHDTRTGENRKIVSAPGYDGGPFFSPCGTRICYRSDRVGDNRLQLFVADLKFDESGAIVGVEHEHQLTANEDVNWCPYWHPSGEYLVYATSEVSHRNYEVFSIEVPARGSRTPASELELRRVTVASGFDGLPVFSPDGEHLMWTAQRGRKASMDERPTSQVWIARVIDASP